MNSPARKFATYEDLFDLPDNLVGEIIGGRLITQPRPAPRHSWAQSNIGSEIVGPFGHGRGGPGGWWILPEPEIHFIRDIEVAVPDLAGWKRERMPAIPEDHRFEVVPDWLCEILSPSTAKTDRAIKLPIYARFGVAFVWLVDPVARTLEAYELQQGRWLLLATLKDEDAVSLPPFDAVSFSLADLWV